MKKSTNNRTLVILDAHAIIHRAYHALPSFTRSDGTPTGALYGLASMIIRIIEELKPDAIVAAYDLPKPTFRHQAYDAYKAGRAKTDDALRDQLNTSRKIFASFGIECLDAEGFEADDVIGTLVENFKSVKDVSIIIASGDMDTLQLVDGKKVQVFTLKKGINDTLLYDEAGVVARYGFNPVQLVDYKGLRGDPSDNIIGVPGIGEKTATTIIATFGSIEGLYTALDTTPEQLKEAGISDRMVGILRDHRDDAFFSKTLATIRRDAPVKYSIPETSYTIGVDTEKLIEVFIEYEFRSLVPRVKKLFAIANDAPVESIDEEVLRKTSIALWVLYSEDTAPGYEAILSRAKKNTLAEAYEVITSELKKRGLSEVYELIELPLVPIIDKMQKHGIMIDRAHFEMLRTRMTSQLKEIETKVIELAGGPINLNSPKQLSELLFVKLGLKPKGKKKASGAFTTNADTLDSLREEHPVVALILEHREIQKLLSTYVEALLTAAGDDDRVHATFLQHGTTTGRFSSANPNLQNIPARGEGGKEVRHGFRASPGHVFIGSDYSQIELRVLAMLSGDRQLKDTFARGDDIHTTVASSVFNVPIDAVTTDMRRSAKVINFGIIYGMGVSALQKNLGTTKDEATLFYNNYFLAFPTIGAYMTSVREDAKTHGYTTTLFGRRRYFPGITSSAPFLRAFAERMAGNAPIQGTAADIIKLAIPLVESDLVMKGLIDRAHLVLQVHDELVYEVEESVAKEVQSIIERAMTEVFERSVIKIDIETVPLTVSVGVGYRLDELK